MILLLFMLYKADTLTLQSEPNSYSKFIMYDIQQPSCFTHRHIMQYKWTPLHLAAQNGHTEVVKSLVELGADIGAVEGVRLCVHA